MTETPSDLPPGCGPWNPGLHSQIPPPLLGLATLYRAEYSRVGLPDLREVADLTGLPLRLLAALRPERLALHELLVRVTANVSVPDGTRIEDLGINFRHVTTTILERAVVPALPRVRAAYEAVRTQSAAIVDREIGRLYEVASLPPARTAPRWLERWRRQPAPAAPPDPHAVIADWEARTRDCQGVERHALRALARVAAALMVKHGRIWGDRDLVARVAVDLATNEGGSDAIGAVIEPLVREAAVREGYALLTPQERPVVMNTKGPSAAGKSTMRPLQKALAARIGVDWSQFAFISPDIWRKQLLDYASLGANFKYAGAFTGDELTLIDQKLDRYMAAKAQRGDVSHLLIDRFRFDSFAPDSAEAGSNLLTRFGQVVYLFFVVTPPVALVERAWQRGLAVGRYKAVDDTLAHAVEAYTGMPELLFTWVGRRDKRVHVEFLDNSVARGEVPRTAAYGWNDVLNVLDPVCLASIERYQRIAIDAHAPAEVYPVDLDVSPEAHTVFLRRCVTDLPRIRFAEQATGRIYVDVTDGKVRWIDAECLHAQPEATQRILRAVLPALDAPAPPLDAPSTLPESDRVHTVGAWATELPEAVRLQASDPTRTDG
ncbi:MAG: hypothetical protein IT522_16445 [Burkholderiales bacterium]|nr:hypothetical protein [Burkholderiales bacterium]